MRADCRRPHGRAIRAASPRNDTQKKRNWDIGWSFASNKCYSKETDKKRQLKYMKKILLLLTIFCFPLFASAQTAEKQYYIYHIITFSGSLKNEGLKVDVDDGKTIEKLKDENGNRIKFNTPAAAFMYLNSLGWELYVNGATTEGAVYGGIGGSTTTSYWIMRKPCTKEEFEQAVEQGIKK